MNVQGLFYGICCLSTINDTLDMLLFALGFIMGDRCWTILYLPDMNPQQTGLSSVSQQSCLDEFSLLRICFVQAVLNMKTLNKIPVCKVHKDTATAALQMAL